MNTEKKIALGTAAIGRPHYINIKRNNGDVKFDMAEFIQKGISMLSFAYKNGVRHFDTAPGYGIAEKILQEWISIEQPEGITISSKWGYTYVADFNPKAELHEIKDHSLSKLNEQWENSLALLPFLKTYQIHSATLDSGVLENQEVLDRLFELKQKYKLEIGLSVSGANQNEIVKKALEVKFKAQDNIEDKVEFKIENKKLFDSFQITFNVFEQSLLTILKELQDKNKTIIIKEALANGRVFPNENYVNYRKSYQILQKLATKYGVGIDAIALQFCLTTINPSYLLLGASEKDDFRSNLKASKVELTQNEIALLKQMAIEPQDYWEERKKLVWN